MNGYANRQVFVASMASNGLTATVDLGLNAWQRVFFDGTAMGAQWSVYASRDGSTYSRLNERINTATVQFQAVNLPSTVSGTWAPLDVNARYLQFVATATATNGAACYVVCT